MVFIGLCMEMYFKKNEGNKFDYFSTSHVHVVQTFRDKPYQLVNVGLSDHVQQYGASHQWHH